MKTFLVTVHNNFVKVVDWQTRSQKQCDAIAMVDGERHQYYLSRYEHTEKKSSWRERGMMHLHYHAKNSGNLVRWLPVGHVKQSRKKKISEKQKSLF